MNTGSKVKLGVNYSLRTEMIYNSMTKALIGCSPFHYYTSVTLCERQWLETKSQGRKSTRNPFFRSGDLLIVFRLVWKDMARLRIAWGGRCCGQLDAKRRARQSADRSFMSTALVRTAGNKLISRLLARGPEWGGSGEVPSRHWLTASVNFVS